jgi:hypothetical protein
MEAEPDSEMLCFFYQNKMDENVQYTCEWHIWVKNLLIYPQPTGNQIDTPMKHEVEIYLFYSFSDDHNNWDYRLSNALVIMNRELERAWKEEVVI